MQRSEQTTGGKPVAAGVPGTASNAPNTQALPVYPQLSSGEETAKTESGTYGASKTVRHLVENPGRVSRMTAAIVVNDRMAQAASHGKSATWQPRSTDELRNLTALAQASVGFNPARGDLLTVEDLAFDENKSLQPVSPLVQGLATVESAPVLVKYVALLAGVFVVLTFGVRPALRRASPAALAKGRDEQPDKELPAETSAAKLPAANPPDMTLTDPERARTQEIFEQVTQHLKREPSQSSRLLQSWIHSD
jgi:flagellar M-ring protein FliF